jgi:hypothetical protein
MVVLGSSGPPSVPSCETGESSGETGESSNETGSGSGETCTSRCQRTWLRDEPVTWVEG